jgi:6-phosphofructokinase 1
VLGIPKTIDNDLKGTDVTIGFDSALTIATESIDRLHTTAEAHHRVMVVEVMGRYAGWIALRSGMAGGGDVILIPEIPYDPAILCNALETRLKRGRRFSIVVVAEGAHPKKGKMIVDRLEKNSPDPVRLGGIGKFVARSLEDVGFESRVNVLGHLQRGGTPTPFDRWIATQYGVMAVQTLARGKAGVMTAMQDNKIITIPLERAVQKLHRVDPRGVEVRSAMAVGTSFGI